MAGGDDAHAALADVRVVGLHFRGICESQFIKGTRNNNTCVALSFWEVVVVSLVQACYEKQNG